MKPIVVFVCAAAIAAPAAALSRGAVLERLQGRYDNAAQLAARPPSAALPNVSVTVEPTSRPDFALWRVRVQTDVDSAFDQTWAMQTRTEHDGSGALIPYYELHQDAPPPAAAFDPAKWLSLEACALRGNVSGERIEAMSEGEPCVAVSMGIGARRALLPVGVASDGDGLGIDLNLRGARTRIEMRRAR